jgi:spermidine synthase
MQFFKVTAVVSARAAYISTFGSVAVWCLSFASRSVRFGLGITAFLIASTFYTASFAKLLYAGRSFFGVYRVAEQEKNRVHILFHGTTIHGAENFGPGSVLQPTTYYHPNGPAGQVFRVLARDSRPRHVAVVGLGSGAMACYGRRGDTVTFYEIDPLVEQIARNPRLFTYVRDCLPQTDVVIGDARLSLARAPDHRYDVIVLDAFSSDAIPVHLLTQEAVELYLSKLSDSGILLFHISNRFLTLGPVLARIAENLKLAGLEQRDFRGSQKDVEESKTASHWVMIAHRRKQLTDFLSNPRWTSLDANPPTDLWTDQYSNIVRVIEWKQ